MKAVVAAFNQEKALVGALSVTTNLRMELFEALLLTCSCDPTKSILLNPDYDPFFKYILSLLYCGFNFENIFLPTDYTNRDGNLIKSHFTVWRSEVSSVISRYIRGWDAINLGTNDCTLQ